MDTIRQHTRARGLENRRLVTNACRRLLSILLGALLLATPLLAQQRTFRETSDVIVIEVPVQVLRGTEPVKGLTRDDFTVLDGKKKLEIVGFDEIDLSLTDDGRFWTESDREALPVSGRRHFLMLFDLSFSDPESILRSREAAKELVVNGLHPADLVGVSSYSEHRGIQLILNFTGDRDQILAAIDGLGVADPLDRPPDPLRVMIAQIQNEADSTVGGGGATGPGPGRAERVAMFLNHLKDQEVNANRTAREQKQGQIMQLTSGLAQVAGLLNSVQGQAHVVLLSEGFDSTVVLGTSIEDRERIEEIQRRVDSGEYWRVDSDERFGSGAALLGLTQALEQFKRAGAAIQAVDIAGLRAGNTSTRDALVKQDGLFYLANETGGELIRNFNDLSEAMDEVLERTSVTYLLAVQPRDLELNGRYHELQVKLRSGKGLRLVHRPGFYAPMPYAQSDSATRRMQTAQLLFGSGEGGSISTEVLSARQLPDESGRSWASVVIEADGPSLLAGTEIDMLPIEVYAYALRRNGSIGDFFAQALSLDLSDARQTLTEAGLRFVGHLHLPTDDYRLRVLVRNSHTGALGLASSDLTIEPQPQLLSPAIFGQSDYWLTAQMQGEFKPTHSTFGTSTFDLEPAALGRFESGEFATLSVMATASTSVRSASLVFQDSSGQEVGSRLEVSPEVKTGGETAALRLSFEVPSLPAGRYDLRVVLDVDDSEPLETSAALLIR